MNETNISNTLDNYLNNSCKEYYGNINDLFLMPFQIYWSKLCISYDRTNLFIYTFSRLLIYISLYIYTIDIFKNNLIPDNYYYLDNFLLSIIFLNVISLSLTISNVPIYNK